MIASGNMYGASVRVALWHSMKRIEHTCRDIHDLGVRLHFEREFWTCAALWQALIHGTRFLEHGPITDPRLWKEEISPDPEDVRLIVYKDRSP